jgi:hypothetical protein
MDKAESRFNRFSFLLTPGFCSFTFLCNPALRRLPA